MKDRRIEGAKGRRRRQGHGSGSECETQKMRRGVIPAKRTKEGANANESQAKFAGSKAWRSLSFTREEEEVASQRHVLTKEGKMK